MLTDYDIVTLYLRGYTTGEIGSMRGVRLSKSAVCKIIARVGVPLRARGFVPKRRLTPRQYRAFYDTYPTDLAKRAAAIQTALGAPAGHHLKLPAPDAPVVKPVKPAKATPKAAPRAHVGRGHGKGLRAHADEIVRRYQGGESGQALGAAFNVNPRSIYNLLRAEGVKRRPRGSKTAAGIAQSRAKQHATWERKRQQAPATAPIDPTLAARNAALAAERQRGASYGELADKYGISRQRVAQILSRAGVTKPRGAKAVKATVVVKPAKQGKVAAVELTTATLDRLEEQLRGIDRLLAAFAEHFVLTPRLPDPADQNGNGTAPLVQREASLSETWDGVTLAHGTGALPAGWRYMTETERLQAWAGKGGTPPANLVVRVTDLVTTDH